MTFLPECGPHKSLYFSIEKDFSLFKWMHLNDFMYVRSGGMRNAKTWSKSMVEVMKSFFYLSEKLESILLHI